MIERFLEALKRDGAVTFTVRVRPAAHKTRMVSIMLDGTLKIDLGAPAEEGRANMELLRFLATSFDVPLMNVKIAGLSSRRKTVTITLTSKERRPPRQTSL